MFLFNLTSDITEEFKDFVIVDDISLLNLEQCKLHLLFYAYDLGTLQYNHSYKKKFFINKHHIKFIQLWQLISHHCLIRAIIMIILIIILVTIITIIIINFIIFSLS